MTTQLIDALTARTNFGQVMQKATTNNTRYLVSKRGAPKVVILGIEDYMKNVIKTPNILTEIHAEVLENKTSITESDITKEIHAARKSAKRTKK